MDVPDLILLVRDCSFHLSEVFNFVIEIAFVGKAPGQYAMLLGGGYHGQRLNKIYRGLYLVVFFFSLLPRTILIFFLAESVREPEILAILRPMIKRYSLERLEGERFGDFTIRAGYIAPTTEGKLWYDRSGGEGDNREASSDV